MNPDALQGNSDAVANIYADAQVHLIGRIAAALEKGIDAPDWAVRQLSAVNAIAGEARAYLATLTPTVASAITSAVTEAGRIGTAGADDDIDRIPDAPVRPVAAINTAAVNALAAETVAAVTSTHGGILRSVTDSYRSIVAEVAGRTVTGVATRREVTQQALNKFADAGIGVFTDRAGRNWGIDSYAEMAIRTATLRTMHRSHTARLKQRGYDLVVISLHPNSAPVCKPFEGKILSLSGNTPNGRHTFESARDGSPVRETVFASMQQAEAAGLHHPNCAHRHALMVPGVARPAVLDEDDAGYEDNQELRRRERAVRQWKRREAAAITPEEKAKARAKVKEKQAAIREHVDATGVRRQRHREQLRTGNTGTTASKAAPARPATPPPVVEHFERLSEDDGRDYGAQHWKAFAESVDDAQRTASIDYTGFHYERMNDGLRNNTPINNKLAESVRVLDSTIAKAPRVPDNITVARSVGAAVNGLDDTTVDPTSLIGKRRRDDGFMSVAMQSALTNPLERNEIELRLDIPEGTRGLYVSSHEQGDARSLAQFGDSENELILGRGVEYEIVDAIVDIDESRRHPRKTVLLARLISQSDKPREVIDGG